jgi:hypothetical protein
MGRDWKDFGLGIHNYRDLWHSMVTTINDNTCIISLKMLRKYILIVFTVEIVIIGRYVCIN